MTAVVLLLVLARPPLITLIAVAIVDGSLSALFLATQSSAIRQVLTPVDMPTAAARNQAYRQAAQIAGPPLGSALYAVAWSLPFH